jgi:hypothetical protein
MPGGLWTATGVEGVRGTSRAAEMAVERLDLQLGTSRSEARLVGRRQLQPSPPTRTSTTSDNLILVASPSDPTSNSAAYGEPLYLPCVLRCSG